MNGSTTRGEERARRVTSRGGSTRSRKDGGPAVAVLAGLVVLALAGIGAYVALGGSRSTPAAPISVATPRPFTAAERVTLVAGARAYSRGNDPGAAGLDAAQTVAWRELAAAIEAGRAGESWPTFRADLDWLARTMAQGEALARRRGNDRAQSDIAALHRQFDGVTAGIDAGDLTAARAALSRYRATHADFVDTSK